MANNTATRRNFFSAFFLNLFVICLSIVVLNAPALAQTSATDGLTPLALSPGAPAGSYALSGFESVNAYNGNLSFRLPLLDIGGRGTAGYQLTLPIEQHWRVLHKSNDFQMIEIPTSSPWKALGPRFGAGRLEGRVGVEGPCPPVNQVNVLLSRLTFTTPDGTEYELRDQLTGGRPQGYTCGIGSPYPSRGKVFVTADGTAATFISDTTIRDDGAASNPSGYLSLRDGTRYRIDLGSVTWIRDRNGNKLRFSYGENAMTITDSLNRQVFVQYADLRTTFYDQIAFRGYGGAQRIIRINYALLHTVLRTNRPGDLSSVQTPAALFPQLTGSNANLFDSYVISSVTLPDGTQKFQFLYNVYGELARATLPTGGAFEYDFGNGTQGEDGTGVIWNAFSQPEIYRRVLRRRTYLDGGSNLEGLTTYSRPEMDTPGYVEIDHFKNDQSTLLSRERHYFHGSASSSFDQGPLDYPAWREGREYQTEYYAANGRTLLKRVNQNWYQHNVSWWSGNPDHAPSNNPHINENLTVLADTGQVSRTTHINPQNGQIMIDQFNNVLDTWVYDYGPGAPGSLLNHTHSDYLTTNNGVDYTNRTLTSSPHLLSLPTRQSVYDANEIERARTTFEYDNYGNSDNYHAGIKDWPAITGFAISGMEASFNSSYTSRGNVTATTRYLLANNQVTGTITGYTQYDLAGNVVKIIDARSTPGNIIATTLSYDDCFGSPDAEAQTNNAPVPLASVNQRSYAFPTAATNALGQVAYTQFDYDLGRPVNLQDVNGTVFSGYYNDPLDRPTKVISASNLSTSFQSQTLFSYDDPGRNITTAGDLNSFGDQILTQQLFYDGLGRTTETRQYEGGGNYIATRRVYDAMGRVYQSSNPFRPWKNEVPSWNTTTFDALNRTTALTTADGATATTSYTGSSVTVSDQIGKKRNSVSDALGQLTQVYEDPYGANWLTSYSYNALGDLTMVNQANQLRSFVYDSLGRLTSATNPENGTVNNTYDNNGNLLTRTDARGITTTFAYDALNRVRSKTYQNDPTGTEAVNYFYDGQSLPAGAPADFPRGSSIGRLVAVTYGNTGAGDYHGYDVLGRSVLKIQRMGTNNYQTTATYNASGRAASMTYPSGHTLTLNYDQAGRLGDRDAQNPALAGNLGDGGMRIYSSGITYSSRNVMAQEKFGTETPIYNKLFYNSRGQLAEIRASTTPNNTSWNRGAIINQYSNLCWGMCTGQSMTDNNGNLKRQDVYVPNNDQVSSYTTWSDAYSYDDVNRLTQVHEYTGNVSLDWQQEYTYDRWGNRTVHQSNTWGGNIPEPNFSVSTSNNRLAAPAGYSMAYDAAGNLTNDTYTGAGQRIYDAENRMISAQGSPWSFYTYDAEGHRVKRNVNNEETWQVYGISGELLSEYAANATPATPQKEYGYRNGRLLVAASSPSATRINFARSSNGATASVSSTWGSGYGASGVINGERKGSPWGSEAGWNDSTTSYPDWLQVDFNGSKTIDEIDVFSLQDNYMNPIEPTADTTFSLYGNTAFDVQYWNGSAWVTVPGGSVTGNNKIWRRFTFPAITTNKIRVLINSSLNNFSRLTEVEAWGNNVTPPPRSNFALASNGATASVSSTWGAGYGGSGVINGERKGSPWGSEAGWNDVTPSYPDWLQVDFNGSKTIDEIDVFSLQDNYTNPIEPTPNTTFSLYGNTAFDVQYWNGSAWVTVPGGSVTGNNKIWRTFTFPAITTNKIRVLINSSLNNYSRLTEVEAWGTSGSSNTATADVEWLVTDQLGTPRMIFDKTGNLLNTKRHDYLPFGEELVAGVGHRSVTQGYSVADGIRQKFTEKERDTETGLDYFLARYYANAQGRFANPDPLLSSGRAANPQSWNRYTYVLNNPLRFVDPDGLVARADHLEGQQDPTPPPPVKPPQELVAAIISRLTEVILLTDGQRTGDGVMVLDQRINDEIMNAIDEGYARGVETGSLAGASNGLAIPTTVGTEAGVGMSTTLRITPDGPAGDINLNASKNAQKEYEVAAGKGIRADIENRAANSETVARVAGNLQNSQVIVNTLKGPVQAIAPGDFWRGAMKNAMNAAYGEGIKQGISGVGPQQVFPAKKPF